MKNIKEYERAKNQMVMYTYEYDRLSSSFYEGEAKLSEVNYIFEQYNYWRRKSNMLCPREIIRLVPIFQDERWKVISMQDFKELVFREAAKDSSKDLYAFYAPSQEERTLLSLTSDDVIRDEHRKDFEFVMLDILKPEQ